MKLAIIGSRSLTDIVIDEYMPDNIDEIVSGGAKGVDSLALEYANKKGIPITEFKPKYYLFNKGAPIKRDKDIADYADEVIAFWDGVSKGTQHTINFFEERGKKVTVIIIKK